MRCFTTCIRPPRRPWYPPQGGGGGSPPLEPDDETPLYVARRKIYPQAREGDVPQHQVGGTRGHARHLLSAAVCAVGSWSDRARPGGVDRFSRPAGFISFSSRYGPQEVYYITGLLIIAALALFLMNAVAGRVWCGYLCPQNGVDRSFLCNRTVCRGRPARAFAAGPRTAEF